MAKIKAVENDVFEFQWFCPGCDHAHGITTKIWTFNGDFDKPTIRNSFLCYGVKHPDGRVLVPRCHCWITDGRVEFLEDCDHALKLQTVDLPDFDQATAASLQKYLDSQ